jgi:hypothetical protein
MEPVLGQKFDGRRPTNARTNEMFENMGIGPGDEMNVIENRIGRVEDDPEREGGVAGQQRYTRRLSDKILIAFHHACDQADFEVAQQLLGVLEMMLTRRPLVPDGTRRRSMESLVAAYERLWYLKHPQTEAS